MRIREIQKLTDPMDPRSECGSGTLRSTELITEGPGERRVRAGRKFSGQGGVTS